MKIKQLEYQNKLNEAELINLRSQLNPHFLFNALNSIHSMTLTGKTESSDAVLLLSDLMRYTLNYEKKNFVTIDEEMAIVKKYLQLEKIRYGKRLSYGFDIKTETLDLKIPPIIVQTLVENAVKHGVAKLREGGYININAYIENDNMYIDIINTGQLPPSVLTSNSGGIGVENTQKRLKMLYGDDAQFSIYNKDETTVLAQLEFKNIEK